MGGRVVAMIDWSFLAQINLWQVAVVILAMYVLGRVLVKFWPWLKRLTQLVDSLAQLPAFITRTDEAIEDIRHEVKYNNGSSVKDGIRRLEESSKSLHTKYDDLARALAVVEQAAPRATSRKKAS